MYFSVGTDIYELLTILNLNIRKTGRYNNKLVVTYVMKTGQNININKLDV